MEAPFTIEYVKDGNYIRVNVYAPVTRELADDFTLQAEDECKRLGARNYLVDAGRVRNISSVNDNVEFSAWDMKVTGLAAQVKRAVLVAPEDHTHDLPIEAMHEMGFNVRKFTNEQKAIEWLTTNS